METITSRLRHHSLKQTKIDLPPEADRNYLESRHYESTWEVYRYMDVSGLGKFTSSFVDSLWNSLNDTVHHLERLPEEAFKELMGVIEGLTRVRNELRHARFLFDVEEIHPVHRLVMRNRAVLEGKDILYRIILNWPHR